MNQTTVATTPRSGNAVVVSPLATRQFGSVDEVKSEYSVLYRDMGARVPVQLNRAFAEVKEKATSKFFVAAGLSATVAVAVGFVLLQIVGYLAAAGVGMAAFGGIAYWYKFKLSGIIARAQNTRKQELRTAYNEALEAARAEEVRHLDVLKKQATDNPIATLELELQSMEAEKKALSAANTAFRSQEQLLTQALADGRRRKPTGDFTEQQTQLDDFRAICDRDDAELTDYIGVIEQMNEVLEEARIKWNFAVQLDRALAQRDAARGNETQRKILKDTALDSIRERHSGLFARIHTRAVELSAAQAIKVGGVKVDVSHIQLPNPKKD